MPISTIDPQMLKLVIASKKGGTGKTTLTGNMGVEADRSGAGPVAVIDTDEHSGAERSLPLLHLVEMRYQPRP
jgi:cellulose biosynthesis protein BcsQ